MIGKLTEERSGIPVCGKLQEGRQSPLLRTAQLNIGLEHERMIVLKKTKLIVSGRGIFVCRNCSGLTESQTQAISSIAGNDQDCI
jgi:predicted RNA-binding protein YlxR (DUF448 family)